jgi:tight adherence protein B
MLLACAALAVAGPGATLAWLRHRRRARLTRLAAQLPDALDMIRASLQAGHSLNHAFELVAEEGPDPLAAELRRVLEELRLGHPLKEALAGLHARSGLADLRFLSVAVVLNRDLGGNLSEILAEVARTVRERFKLRGQVRALTSQGRFSASVLAFLMPVLGVAISTLDPDYLEPLFHTPLGRGLLVYAVLSTAVGYWLMRRIVDIRVVRVD